MEGTASWVKFGDEKVNGLRISAIAIDAKGLVYVGVQGDSGVFTCLVPELAAPVLPLPTSTPTASRISCCRTSRRGRAASG